jgi:hypothetical protein
VTDFAKAGHVESLRIRRLRRARILELERAIVLELLNRDTPAGQWVAVIASALGDCGNRLTHQVR